MSDIIYNEIDPFAAQWLRNLCADDLITPGEVDETDVRSLPVRRVRDARRFHAFAGIGVWDYAIRLADWPDDVPIWTGSCPCQPFSTAGRRRGTADDRHLWPAWFRLIRECRPPVVVGEQVASPAGRTWFGSVRADLEALGYSVGAADLCAAGVGAPHVRQRLFFVAYTNGPGLARRTSERRDHGEELSSAERDRRPAHRVANPDVQRRQSIGLQLQSGQSRQEILEASGRGETGGMADTNCQRQSWKRGSETTVSSRGNRRSSRCDSSSADGPTRGFWSPADWLVCRDGVARPVEPGTFPLAHGVAGRVAARLPVGSPSDQTHWYNRRGALHGIGNAIVPQVAAEFLGAVIDALGL